jgi:dTDP-4-amino-4,6-dideoxygalactose transaminase
MVNGKRNEGNIMSEMINYGKHYIDDDDTAAVTEVLKSEFLTTGPIIEKFEKQLTNYTGYKYAIVVNSGTAALHSALFAAGIGPGDEVIVPALTFIATANVVLYLGAKPVFADIDPDTLLIDIDNVKKLITKNTKALICMDYAGQKCYYLEFKALCMDYDLTLISDACHSFGATNKHFDNQIAEYECYSFHPVKNITTGEGGAVLTNSYNSYKTIKAFINHGRYEHCGMVSNHIGYNYKMPDINAALGISQLRKVKEFIKRRAEIAEKYNEELSYCSLKQININVYHLYVIKVTVNIFNFINNMAKNGIKCICHYMPVYYHPVYSDYKKLAAENCKNTEYIKDKIISLPIYYSLTDAQINKIIKLVKQFNPIENFEELPF